MNQKKRILYVGGFQLPDKNAAAHRVLGIGKSMREVGYTVEYLSVSDEYIQDALSSAWDCQGFKVYTQRHSFTTKQRIQYSLNPLHVEEILNRYNDWFAVVAYNYPAVALHRLSKICYLKNIKVISDCTEWYAFEPKTVSGFLNFIDSEMRMRIVQKNLDGMIAISEYLGEYYKGCLPTIVVPPTVDIDDAKWHQKNAGKQDNILVLTYAGSYSISRAKDRLDKMISSIANLPISVRLNIIGFTKDQYMEVYHDDAVTIDLLMKNGKLVFWGRMKHEEALRVLQQSDYCMFFREKSRVTQAGFPTKFVESISCGIPVLTTETSDLKNYIKGNGFFVSSDEVGESLMKYKKQVPVLEIDTSLFDYRKYSREIEKFLQRLESRHECT
jgi:glycosyltransferase involved in cell wall biosynthesis